MSTPIYPLSAQNPLQERVWVKASDGVACEVTVDDVGAGPQLVAAPVWQNREPLEYVTAGSLLHMQQPTGAMTRLIGSSGTQIFVVPSFGTYAFEDGGTAIIQPPTYLYNMTQVVAKAAGTESWANRTEFGLALGVPALDGAGLITFLTDGTLLPGPHRLDIDAACIGNAGHVGLRGFDVEITVGKKVLPVTLLTGVVGESPRRAERVEFNVESLVAGRWAVDFKLMSGLSIPAQGIQRDFAVHGLEVRRMQPVACVVVSAATVSPLDLLAMPLSPGGWRATLDSAGSILAWEHESNTATREVGDTFTSMVPISGMLTGATERRTEDILLAGYAGTLTTPADLAVLAPDVSVVESIVATPASVAWLLSGGVTARSAKIYAKVSGSAYARAYISQFSTLSNAVPSAVVEVGSSGIAAIDVSGLEPGTRYYYAVGDLVAPNATILGSLVTMPEGAVNFSFAFSADAASYSNSPVFDVIRGLNPTFFLHLGDMHYDNITVNDPALYRAAFEAVLAQPRQAALYRSTSLVYTWDDHDYGGNNSDSTSPSRPAAQATFREYIPAHQLPSASGAIYRSFSCGRAFFIILDTRSARGPFGTTMLGVEQKLWLKRQLLDASRRFPLIFLACSVPWIGNVLQCDDGWCRYTAERQELADFIAAAKIKGLVILGADMHALAADDGSNSQFSAAGGKGPVVLQAAPLDQVTSHKGETYSQGVPLPNPAGPVASQFGLVSVIDTGSEIQVIFSGRGAYGVELLPFSFTVSR
jgi:phosphodiesterase/alkaline phosphatase D-like protein